MSENLLLSDIRKSIVDMQQQMQATYSSLADQKITGASSDGTVKITMTAAYAFVDIEFDQRALEGGVAKFKERIREAWKAVSEAIQKATQSKTMELLQGMNIPDDIRNLSLESTGNTGGEAA